ncbi:dirigent protein 23 [Prunus yedoensis var. nudiflora]|uniref:Dirigent protein n=1 Tax=Prunus yedoensis var. nudiflora TaxID=2094558 RepID=A0A314YQP2_PRUYE|nr:dirigent protein 23 [Prunus yedoensis var. nudiflora]PQQ09053.1 dirigent protein 23 [Prunus yedoensis var. nudiflora]
MANPATPLILLMLISLLAAIEGAQDSTELMWAKKLKTRKKTTSETVTNLQFYFHDTLSGKTPSAVRVAQATDTNKSPTLFGALLMADDPLTETPDPNSKLVGRAQGLYGSSCQQELGLIMAMNFGFTDGMYNGSSISILGKNQAMNLVREMPVVAGTGVFRLGRGYAIAKTHWIDFTTGDAIVGYNVTVIH